VKEQFDAGQVRRAVELLERLPWGDIDPAICDMEAALRLAMEATREEFQHWEDTIGPELEQDRGWNEFSVPATHVDQFTSEEKLAYVARLLRSLALAYGVSTDPLEAHGARFKQHQQFRPPSLHLGENDPHAPAELLRGLNEIRLTPTVVAEGPEGRGSLPQRGG
jgi:hypothetical protein